MAIPAFAFTVFRDGVVSGKHEVVLGSFSLISIVISMTISQLGNGGYCGLDLKLLKEHNCTAYVKDTGGCPYSMLLLICHLLLYFYNANVDRPLLVSATGDLRRTMQRFISTAPSSSWER